jgi:phosphate:Na+ symporter
MADMAGSMIGACRRGLIERGKDSTAEVFETEAVVDSLKRAIEDYLDRIHGNALSDKEERRLHVLQHVTGDIERVGDQAVNIAQRTLMLAREKHVLSEPARHDLDDLFERTAALYERAVDSLRDESRELARDALELEKDVDRLEDEYRANHLMRLDRDECNADAGILFVEILHNLERMGDHAVNIAGDVLHAI